MAYETLTGGLQLVLPTNGTKNWGTVLRNSTWLKINNHQHTGSGDGNKLTSASFVSNSVDETAITKNFPIFQQATVTQDGSNLATINWNNGGKSVLDISTATASVALTLTNPKTGGIYRITVLQGATVRSVLWPVSVKWPAGEEPSQFMSANSKNVVYLDYDGAEYIATWELDLD